MRKFIKTYENEDEKRFNFGLLNREYDEDIVTYIADSCKSLEVLDGITFLGYELIDDEAQIDQSAYIKDRKRKKTKKNFNERYMFMKDSRVLEMILMFKLEGLSETKKSKDGKKSSSGLTMQTKYINKRILIPFPDEDGYYTIKGTRYLLMYQLVDNSTYTTTDTLTQRATMPISLKKKDVEYEDINSIVYTAPTYNISISKKDVPAFILFFAKMGVSNTLRYFSSNRIIKLKNEIEDEQEFIYFRVNKKMYVEVNRYFFEKYKCVRSIVFMLLTTFSNRMTQENIDDKNYWIEKLGSYGTISATKYREKGLSTLAFYGRILDNTTKKVLKIHEDNKSDIYALLRWMITNFDELRSKDNLNLNNKRLRCNEYIAQLLTRSLTERVNRILSLGKEPSLKDLTDIFKFKGDIFIQQLFKSSIFQFDDQINDQDIWGKLKFTQKGPQSLGNKNVTTTKYRGIDPSYIGRFDLNVCGSSDPGTTGVLTPYCKTEGLYFNATNSEPQSFRYELEKDIFDYHTKKYPEMLYVGPVLDSEQTFFDYYVGLKKNKKELWEYPKKKEDGRLLISINLMDEEDYE